MAEKGVRDAIIADPAESVRIEGVFATKPDGESCAHIESYWQLRLQSS